MRIDTNSPANDTNYANDTINTNYPNNNANTYE